MKTDEEKLDAKYRQWIQRQPSALSQTYGEFPNGQGRNDAAHYRTSGNAGVGMKPLFSCLPLTHREHMRQHGTSYTLLEGVNWWEFNLSIHQFNFERETGHKIPEKYRVHYEI